MIFLGRSESALRRDFPFGKMLGRRLCGGRKGGLTSERQNIPLISLQIPPGPSPGGHRPRLLNKPPGFFKSLKMPVLSRRKRHKSPRVARRTALTSKAPRGIRSNTRWAAPPRAPLSFFVGKGGLTSERQNIPLTSLQTPPGPSLDGIPPPLSRSAKGAVGALFDLPRAE